MAPLPGYRVSRNQRDSDDEEDNLVETSRQGEQVEPDDPNSEILEQSDELEHIDQVAERDASPTTERRYPARERCPPERFGM